MSGTSTEGRVYHERHDHVLKIVIDNPAKKNAFSPKMMEQLSDAFTLLDKEEDLWVGVLCANGDNFTAGLDMPKFFGPTATREPRPEGNIDPFGLARPGAGLHLLGALTSALSLEPVGVTQCIISCCAMNLRPPKPIGLDLFKRLCPQVNKMNARWSWRELSPAMRHSEFR